MNPSNSPLIYGQSMLVKENMELKEELAVARGVGKTADDALTALKLSSAKDREEMIALKMQLNELTKEGETLRKKSSRVEELEGDDISSDHACCMLPTIHRSNVLFNIPYLSKHHLIQPNKPSCQ